MISRIRAFLEDLSRAPRGKVICSIGLGVLAATIPWNPDIAALEPFLRWWISGGSILLVGGSVSLLAKEVRAVRTADLLEWETEQREMAELARADRSSERPRLR